VTPTPVPRLLSSDKIRGQGTIVEHDKQRSNSSYRLDFRDLSMNQITQDSFSLPLVGSQNQVSQGGTIRLTGRNRLATVVRDVPGWTRRAAMQILNAARRLATWQAAGDAGSRKSAF